MSVTSKMLLVHLWVSRGSSPSVLARPLVGLRHLMEPEHLGPVRYLLLLPQ